MVGVVGGNGKAEDDGEGGSGWEGGGGRVGDG